eukprot:SM000200S05824  [mRNA]  locus=s200:186435:196386:+ [translate_table: standard]
MVTSDVASLLASVVGGAGLREARFRLGLDADSSSCKNAAPRCSADRAPPSPARLRLSTAALRPCAAPLMSLWAARPAGPPAPISAVEPRSEEEAPLPAAEEDEEEDDDDEAELSESRAQEVVPLGAGSEAAPEDEPTSSARGPHRYTLAARQRKTGGTERRSAGSPGSPELRPRRRSPGLLPAPAARQPPPAGRQLLGRDPWLSKQAGSIVIEICLWRWCGADLAGGCSAAATLLQRLRELGAGGVARSLLRGPCRAAVSERQPLARRERRRLAVRQGPVGSYPESRPYLAPWRGALEAEPCSAPELRRAASTFAAASATARAVHQTRRAPSPRTKRRRRRRPGDRRGAEVWGRGKAHAESCRAVAFLHGGAALVSASVDRSILTTDVASGKPVARLLDAHGAPVNRVVALSETTLGSGDDDGGVKVWDTRQQLCCSAFDKVHSDYVTDFEPVMATQQLLSVRRREPREKSAPGKAYLLIGKSSFGQVDATSEFADDELLSVVHLKGRAKKVVCGTTGGPLLLYSWGHIEDCSDRFVGHPTSVDTMLKIDEETLVTGSSDGFIRLISVLPNKILDVIGEHDDFPVERLALSCDGAVLASASHEIIKLWDVTDVMGGGGAVREEEQREEAGELSGGLSSSSSQMGPGELMRQDAEGSDEDAGRHWRLRPNASRRPFPVVRAGMSQASALVGTASLGKKVGMSPMGSERRRGATTGRAPSFPPSRNVRPPATGRGARSPTERRVAPRAPPPGQARGVPAPSSVPPEQQAAAAAAAMVAISGLVTSIVTSLLIFLALWLAFTLLVRRPGNAVVYYPARLLKGDGTPPGYRSQGPFTWLRQAWAATDDEVIAYGGLDGYVYIRMFRTCVYILLWASAYCLIVLIPICATSHYYRDFNRTQSDNNRKLKYNDFDLLSMGNIPKGSSKIWAFAIGAYWVTLGTIYFCHKAYADVTRLRAGYQGTSQARPEQYAILVRDIPKPDGKELHEDYVNSFFTRLFPKSFLYSIMATKIKKVEKIWKKLDKAKRKLAHAEAVYHDSKSNGKRPMHKTGQWGLWGKKVDSIEYWTEEIATLTPQLEEAQQFAHEEQTVRAAFVFFSNRGDAAAASQSMLSEKVDAWQAIPAPEPREIIWGNVAMPLYQRTVRELIVYGITFLIIVFYMIPIGLVSAFTTLDNLEKNLGFLKSVLNISVVKAILNAYLPQLALIIFLALLPNLLLFLSKLEGIAAQSHLERAAAGKFFYFNVFNVFLGVTLAGSLFNSLKQIVKNPSSVINLLGSALPQNATFFISFIALKFLVGYGLSLSRVVPLIIFHLKRRFLCKTEQELKDAWDPQAIQYHTAVPNDLLIIMLALCYCVISPLILPFAFAYFAIGYFVQKNAALNVQEPDYESAGRMWPHIHARILASLLIAHITFLGYFGILQFKGTPILAPLPIITLVYWRYTRIRFYPAYCYTPLDTAQSEVASPPAREELAEAFTAPSMLKGGGFDHQEGTTRSHPFAEGGTLEEDPGKIPPV